MNRTAKWLLTGLLMAVFAVSAGTAAAASCTGAPDPATGLCIDPGTGLLIPDYFGSTPNWANSPPLRKFVDTLPRLGCGATNNLGQCIPIAVPDQTAFPDPDGAGPLGADYYEIEVGEFSQKMHTDMPATILRGYRQVNLAGYPQPYQYLGPIIIAQKDRPVRIKFINSLPGGSKLFIPVDTTVMGSGMGAKTAGGAYCDSTAPDATCAKYSENRATLHLHGGLSPWISDGTPHQWITPAAESTPYPKGDSVRNVPDMWFDASGNLAPVSSGCQGVAAGTPAGDDCVVAGYTNDPGPGAMSFYWTNQQSARLMFFHDHSWGITRLNVYVGEAAGYMIQDPTEIDLITRGIIPAEQIPLIIQDKTFVDAATIGTTDPTWAWGSDPGLPAATPKTGDLWWPHVYVPAQNPYDVGGANPMGRWHYGPWIWPPTLNIANPPVANPYYDPENAPWEPPLMPGTPNPSWGAEAFMDTPVINGTAYPTLSVNPRAYRFRVLNAAHDRFFNLQFYEADATVAVPADCPTCVGNTEVRMVPAVATAGFPDTWPTDGRPGGVPDPVTAGPAWIQIGTEGGFLPAPVVLTNTPVNWNTDVTTFNAGNVNQGTLILGPAERADVVVDFSAYAGKTLILYNDAPAPYPALDPHYDYYTGVENLTDIGGSAGTPIGRGPNTRTLMQIKVAAAAATPFNYGLLEAEFVPTAADGVFKKSQNPIIVGQAAYDAIYNMTFPATYPYWGLSRIGDNYLSFNTPDKLPVTNHYMEAKAIQDEMGEVFDEYGRMSAKLGLELPKTFSGVQTFMLQNYVDPSTEIVLNGEPQIWKITHNGVDTHPVHFHLFDVQLVNRVGWDGFIRFPDPNELGWKDTVRISPLEDTIVALRPKAPVLPFTLPASNRLLNPSLPENDGINVIFDPTMSFTQIDPVNGLPRFLTNTKQDFFAEYVWHCHILSHEEADMMRTIVLREPAVAPAVPAAFSATAATQRNTLVWTDTQFRPILPDLTAADFDRATGFRVERRCDSVCTTPATFTTIATITTFSTSVDPDTAEQTYKFQGFADTLIEPGGIYAYRVTAYNSFGDSAPSAEYGATAIVWRRPNGVTITPEFTSPHAAPVKFTAQATFPGGADPLPVFVEYRFSLDGSVVQDYSPTRSWTMPADTALGLRAIAVDVRTSLIPLVPDASGSIGFEVITTPGGPAISSVVPGNGQATVSFTAPASNGGNTITSYTATAVPGGLTGTGAVSPVTVYGLTNGSTYTFTVTATNAAGTGPASGPSSPVTIGPPADVLWVKESTGQALRWKVDPVTASMFDWAWISPAAGVGAGWQASSYVHGDAATDYVLWTNSSAGKAIRWSVNPATGAMGSYVWISPAAGVGAGWQASSYVHVDAATDYVLWTNSSAGQAIRWSVNPATGALDSYVWISPAAGVGAGWQASSYVHVDAATDYVLWTNGSTGQAIRWSVNPATGALDSYVWISPAAGVGAGWQASSYELVDAATDYVLWTSSSAGKAIRWSVNPATGAMDSYIWISPTAGVGAGWQASSYEK